MKKEEIIEKVNYFIVEEFEADQDAIHPEANLRETLALDSLDYVDLVVMIDNNFGIKLNEADFNEVTTFQTFYDLIEAKLLQKAAHEHMEG